MRRLNYLMVVFLIFGLSCVGVPSKPVSNNDIPNLIGKWTGELYCFVHGNTQSIELVIANEKLEGTLKGVKTYHQFSGKIDQNGKLILLIDSPDQYFLMKLATFYENDGKIRMKGDFKGNQCYGTLSFQKV